MLKNYVARSDGKHETVATVVTPTTEGYDSENSSVPEIEEKDCGPKLKNSDILNNIDAKLQHVSREERNQLKYLIREYEHLFPDVPGRTEAIYHDVEVDNAKPVKQHPYRINPLKYEHMK